MSKSPFSRGTLVRAPGLNTGAWPAPGEDLRRPDGPDHVPGTAVPAPQATYGSAEGPAAAVRRAAAAHGTHQQQIGQAGPQWPRWCVQSTQSMAGGHAGRRGPAGPGAGA